MEVEVFKRSDDFLKMILSSRPLKSQMPDMQQKPVGLGVAAGHHGEIIQGAMRHEGHSIQRFLVTMPCHDLVTYARFELSPAPSSRIVVPQGKTKSRKAAEATLRYLQQDAIGGHLTLLSNIDEGFGMGSSTSDVVATIRAVSDAFDVTLTPETIARLAVDTESASDAIMFDNTCVMFAQRHGTVLSYLGSSLPPLYILSVNSSIDAPVDTLANPAAQYNDWEFESFRALTGMLRRAVRNRNPSLLGRVATASALISQRHLPKPKFTDILSIARAHQACGVQVSHSGTMVGLLFDTRCPKQTNNIEAASRDLSSIGITPRLRFSSKAERFENET